MRVLAVCKNTPRSYEDHKSFGIDKIVHINTVFTIYLGPLFIALLWKGVH
jgi:hypothetical protein